MPAATMRLGQALEEGRRRLAEAGIDTPGLDARLLLAAASGLRDSDLVSRGEAGLTAGAEEQFRLYLERRLNREPVARILGRRCFWTFDLEVDDAVLLPRPETEILVETVLDRLKERRTEPLSILDLGTGSGAILLALLSELPCATGVGLDLSPDAVKVARRNAEHLGLGARARMMTGDFRYDIDGIKTQHFDCIVSNPPYVRSRDCERLAPEVSRFDPRLSLDGGDDGLDAYRAVAQRIAQHLRRDGLASVEIGAGQADAVRRLFGANKVFATDAVEDLAGIVRVLLFRK